MKKVVIIGGGFAGAYAAKNLEIDFGVTLIDSKDYFEFTPSILRTIVEPRHITKIQVLHSHYLKNADFIRGVVKEINVREVILDGNKLLFVVAVEMPPGSHRLRGGPGGSARSGQAGRGHAR